MTEWLGLLTLEHRVVGSSPAGGVILSKPNKAPRFKIFYAKLS